jgi:ABC-type multidrug transport system fused ATPase/permease subunit
MKSYNTVYYLLIVLLIMGAFASMAQNSYGMAIISGVCICFGLIFLFQFFQSLGVKEKTNNHAALEFFILFLLALLFTLRSFQIYISFIEWIFAAAGLILALIYFQRMIFHAAQLKSKNKKLSNIVTVGYLSIVLFCLSMVMTTFAPLIARMIGVVAIMLLIAFMAAGLLGRRFLIDGESQSAFSRITGFRDRFYLLLSLFIIFALYFGLSGPGILPKMYSNKYPQAYFEMVNQAETGREKPVNGQYRYQAFKTNYDQFVERNIKNEIK